MDIKVRNEKDLEDFFVSLDLAIKRQAQKEELKPNQVPKILFGEDQTYIDAEKSLPYERPFLTFGFSKRTPASISSNSFFEAPHQHGPAFPTELEDGERKVLYRDNQINLFIRTKTKREQIFLIHFIERVFLFNQDVLKCEKHQFHYTEERERIQLNEFYKTVIIYNIRTKVIIDYIDNAILDKVEITYNTPICKHFNLETYKCDKQDAEKYNTSSDFDCYNTTFCKDYYPKYSFKV